MKASPAPPPVSTPNSQRTCFQSDIGRNSYCGRTSAPIVSFTVATCADCKAAWRADEEAAKTSLDERNTR